MDTLTFVADETELGMVEQQEVRRAITKPTQKRKPQSKYSDEDRYEIAKYAKQHGPNQAAKHFKAKYPTINESSVRGFLQRFNKAVNEAQIRLL